MTGSSKQNIPWDKLLRVDPAHPAPLYQQLKERLRKAASKFRAGSLLPSEAEFVAYAGVSRPTVRRAIAELIQEGALYARRGSGTYAAGRRLETGLNRPEGFTETVKRLGRKPSTQVLALETIAPTRDIAAALNLEVSSRIYVLERLRLVDGEPAMLERACLPAQLLPDLARRDLKGSLYSLLRDVYGLAPETGRETIFAVNADRRLAQVLHVPMATALLASVRVSRSGSGIPLEYTMRHVRPDLCSYAVTLGSSTALTVRPEQDLLVGLETSLGVDPGAGRRRS